jgi:hypothetical protein
MTGGVCHLWLLPALASAASPLMTICYCLRFEIPPTWRARCPYLHSTGTEWPSFTPGTGFPFRCLLRLDSRGYGGGILTRLHTGYILLVAMLSRSLFNDDAFRIETIQLNDRMTDEWRYGNNLDGSSCHNPGTILEFAWGKLRQICQNSLYPGRHSNRSPPEYRTRVLPLDHPARYTHC